MATLPRNGYVQPVEIASSPGTAVPNRPGFVTGQDNVAVHTVAQQLNAGVSQPIPDGFSLFITFKKANSGTNIYVAETAAKAQATTNCKILNSQNSGIRIYITDVSLVWIASDSNGDGVDWIVEKV